MRKIINLLNVGKNTSISSASETSTSMTNTQIGICPKCSKTMSSAAIASGEPCLYCCSCRVALPLPNDKLAGLNWS
jgi:hypothetical protein